MTTSERPSAVRVGEALLAGAGLVFVVIAGLLLFLPLPINEFGTCGPEFGSSSALSVSRDPDQVLDWQSPTRVSDVMLLRRCAAEAYHRVGTAQVVGPGGLLTMVGGPLLVEAVWRRTGRRRTGPPWAPDAAAAPDPWAGPYAPPA